MTLSVSKSPVQLLSGFRHALTKVRPTPAMLDQFAEMVMTMTPAQVELKELRTWYNKSSSSAPTPILDIDALASKVVSKLGSPDIDLGRSGLFELIVGKAVEKGFSSALDRVGGKIDVWVAAEEYRNRYAIKKTSFYQYITDGVIPRAAIKGKGRARRFNLMISPLTSGEK
jgi:hypothetical protein